MRSLAGPFAIGDRLAEDLAAAAPLPRDRFDPCVIHPAVAVDKYQTVAFDGNRYSVPRPFAFRMVTVKGYVDRVVIVARRPGRRHARAIAGEADDGPRPAPLPGDAGPQARRAGPRAGLPRLGACRPASPTSGPGWSGSTAPAAGARQYARVLQLLAEHPLTRLSTAIETCVREQLDTAEAVIRRTRALAAIEAAKRPGPPTPAESSTSTPGRRAAARPEPVRPAPGAASTTARSACSSPDRDHLHHSFQEGPCRWPMSRSSCSRPSFRQLRLPTMGREFERLARDAAATNQTFAQFLLRLTEVELALAAGQRGGHADQERRISRSRRTSTPTTSA